MQVTWQHTPLPHSCQLPPIETTGGESRYDTEKARPIQCVRLSASTERSSHIVISPNPAHLSSVFGRSRLLLRPRQRSELNPGSATPAPAPSTRNARQHRLARIPARDAAPLRARARARDGIDRPPAPARMDGSPVSAGGGGITPGSPTSPMSSRHGGNAAAKRKRSMAGPESSPGSGHDDDELGKKRQPGVKRACNECRQQKVSHVRAQPRACATQKFHWAAKTILHFDATVQIPPVLTAC